MLLRFAIQSRVSIENLSGYSKIQNAHHAIFQVDLRGDYEGLVLKSRNPIFAIFFLLVFGMIEMFLDRLPQKEILLKWTRSQGQFFS